MDYNTTNHMKQGGSEWVVNSKLTLGIDATFDTSAQVETILVAGAISLTKRVTKLSAASGAYAVTLAAPSTAMIGQTKVIDMTVAGNAITLALTNVVGGTASTTASFDAVNESLVLVAGTNKWIVVGQAGVTLS
jgi:hypothetical protein